MKGKILENFDTTDRLVVLNPSDGDPRDPTTMMAQVSVAQKRLLVNVVFSETLVQKGEIGFPPTLAKQLGVKKRKPVSIAPRARPKSVDVIMKKYDRHVWSGDDIRVILDDIYNENLTDLEMAAFTLAIQYENLSDEETVNLTKGFAYHGTQLSFNEPVYDKHSVGGIAGNKVSLVIVPIVAAAGLLIPKTSSRAITSPSGTADTMEVLANVDFTAEEIQEIAPKTRGMIVWGGHLNLAPVDSKIISRIERPLGLDPESIIIASILSKKLATGVKHLVLDMPTGPGTKLETRTTAKALAHKFVEIGRKVGIEVDCALTYADQPVGHAIGPALEAKEALETLMGNGPRSVHEKSVELAGILLEMAKLVPKGEGARMADDILRSGKALAKMREIIDAQGGNAKVMPEDIEIGQYTAEVKAYADGYISHISNTAIKKIARELGCPVNKKAGMYLLHKAGEFVTKGTPLLRIHATKESHLERALNVANNSQMYKLEGMVIERVSASPIE
ncbi:MAG: AMP phosphorylase [Methanobacteriota archaeon]|nr:MAG: AMP phosphorylase [Euryarchaeota archaeon]